MPSIEVLTRVRTLDIAEDAKIEDGVIRMVASTNAPVRVRVSVDGEEQMWEEVLEHSEGQVDACAARAVLINHRPDAIVGSITSVRFDGSSAIVEAKIDPDAKLETGVRVINAVRSGALKGVSIGYGYRADNNSDVTVDYEAKRLTVRKWRFSEVSLVATPADTSAGVRSLNAPPAPLKGSIPMSEVPAEKAGAAPAATAPDAAAIRSEVTKIASLAESHKLRAADYLSLDLPAAQAKMLEDIAARDAKANPKAPITSHIEVGEEAHEKIAKRAVGALLWSAGFQHTDEKLANHEFSDGTKLADMQRGNTIRGRSISDVIRATCESLGVRTGDLDRSDLARIALGNDVSGVRDAANVSTGFFGSFVFLNLAKKAVAIGYQMGGKSIKYEPLVSRNYVPDYKQFAVGSLGLGNLSKTVENAAFPELTAQEGVYLDKVSMWGGTLSLSEQAIVSDDTGRFFDQLRQTGVIAKKTIDRRVFQVLLRGISTSDATSTWTDNTTGSSTIVHTTNDTAVAARANLTKVESALMSKLGLDGNPMGNMASYLVVPSDLGYVAAGLMGVAPGQQNQTSLRYQVIATPWLQHSGLVGYSATSYYLVADPSEATGLVLSTINGFDEPRVEQYDPGAVAAFKWKCYMPFEVGMGAHTYGSKTIIAGVQQGTV